MDEKFQSDTKELDEKFAAIPENLKKRYDMHRFIRRVIIGYYSSSATTIYFSLMLMFFLDLLFSNIGIESSSKIFKDICDVAIIVLPICATICFLRYTKTKRYSNLFIKDQGDSLLVFTIENFASIVFAFISDLDFYRDIGRRRSSYIFVRLNRSADLRNSFWGMLFFQYGLIYPERRSVNFIKFSRAFKFYDAVPRLISKFSNFKILPCRELRASEI